MSWVGSVRLKSVLGCLALAGAGSPVCAQEALPVGSARAAEPPAPVASPVATASAANPTAPARARAPAPAPTNVAAPDESAPLAHATAIPEARFEQESPFEKRGAAHERDASKDVSSAGLFFKPVGVLLGFYGVELDLSPVQSVSFNFTGAYYDHTADGISTTAYGADVGIQFFLSETEPMSGAYIYPRVSYATATASPTGSEVGRSAEASLYGLGATCGYQWNWPPFALRLGGGVMYYSAAGSASGSDAPHISLEGTSLLLDFDLGFVG